MSQKIFSKNLIFLKICKTFAKLGMVYWYQTKGNTPENSKSKKFEEILKYFKKLQEFCKTRYDILISEKGKTP